MIILAYDGSGDFGPQTPHTKTAGWQEAIDYCVEGAHDLYVKGGWGGRAAIYHVSETIRLPATQDFRIDGGVYVVNWIGPMHADLLVIDSSMNCEYQFGILIYGGHGAALRIKPENPVPIDNFPVFVETEVKSQGIADPQPFQRGERRGGTGLVFDGTQAGIVHSDFYFFGVLNFQTCIASSGHFRYNRLECLHLHTNADNSTLLNLCNRSMQNSFRLGIAVDQGATGVRGIDISGKNNTFEVTQRETQPGFAKANTLIFEEFAEGNQVNFIHECLSDPSEIVTDKAQKPTNQITWAGDPAPVQTISTITGKCTYIQRLYPAVVRVVGGDMSELVFMRGATPIDYRVQEVPPRTHEIFMSVGDKLIIESTTPPVLQMIPFKVR